MKCRYDRQRHELSSDQRSEARRIMLEAVQEQSDKVSVRCYNEFILAMLQAGLSKRTVNRTVSALNEIVLPKVEEIRCPDGGIQHMDSNSQQMRDSDEWLKARLEEVGVTPIRVNEVSL